MAPDGGCLGFILNMAHKVVLLTAENNLATCCVFCMITAAVPVSVCQLHNNALHPCIAPPSTGKLASGATLGQCDRLMGAGIWPLLLSDHLHVCVCMGCRVAAVSLFCLARALSCMGGVGV